MDTGGDVMMEPFIIATAGHVDHGKTTLVRALSGIDTDRLAEEKKRGLTIDLGFAYMALPSRRRLGIVDVPGHEKFIKNMVAGLAGIRAAMLVIDSHEGVMAQTVEHAEILKLLHITAGVIVLSKAGGIDKEEIEQQKRRIRTDLEAIGFPLWPLVVTDAVTGLGMDDLIQTLDHLASTPAATSVEGPARLSVDRAFTIKGFGTVVTGTLVGSAVTVGDQVYVYPLARRVRVRQIQIHSQSVTTALPYHRVAFNLSDVSLQDVSRGSVVTAVPMKETTIVDGHVRIVDHSPLPLRLSDRVHVHIGADVAMAQVFPLGCDAIAPDGEGYVQLRFEKKMYLCDDDRFIIRGFSPMTTIGGGIILASHSRKHRRYHEKTLEGLRRRWRRETLFHEDEEKEGLRRKVLRKLWDYHKAHPLRQGMTKSQCMALIRKTMPLQESKAFLALLIESGYCVVHGHYVGAAGFVIAYSREQQRIVNALKELLSQKGYQPLAISRVAAMGRDSIELMRHLPDLPVTLVGDDYVMCETAIKSIEELLYDYFRNHDTLTLATFRDILHIGRKGALILLEYFDTRGITLRKGDVRYFLGSRQNQDT